jgi:hypothetical protein
VTGLRPGVEVHGAGTVVGPGPDPGTSWAVPDDPAVAGVVVDHATHGHLPLTREEQAARMARAELVLARGVVLAWHRLPEGSAYLDEYRVHLVRCAELDTESARLVDDGMWTRVQRGDVALAALRGEAFICPVAGVNRRPATWCPTCLGDQS